LILHPDLLKEYKIIFLEIIKKEIEIYKKSRRNTWQKFIYFEAIGLLSFQNRSIIKKHNLLYYQISTYFINLILRS